MLDSAAVVAVEQPKPVLNLSTVPVSEAIEVDRVAPVCGTLAVRPQQFWPGRSRAGVTGSSWIDTRTVHLSLDGRYYKTLPRGPPALIWPGCAPTAAVAPGAPQPVRRRPR